MQNISTENKAHGIIDQHTLLSKQALTSNYKKNVNIKTVNAKSTLIRIKTEEDL